MRPARALPYDLQAHATVNNQGVTLRFENHGEAGAVFHVYNRRALTEVPRRYTVEPGRHLEDRWVVTPGNPYDLWILGPTAGTATSQARCRAPAPPCRCLR